MLHPWDKASPHIQLPREGKCNFVANVFQHLIFGLCWAILLWDLVGHSHMHHGLCRVMSHEGEASQIMQGSRMTVSIQLEMLLDSYCPGPGVRPQCSPAAGVWYLLLHH